MAYENYIQVTGVIQEISSGSSCCTLQIVLRTDQDMVNFIVNGDTQIIDNIRLRRGMRIAAFYDSSLPAPAIFPPRYQAELITVLRRDQNVMLQYFDENLMAEDQMWFPAMGRDIGARRKMQNCWCIIPQLHSVFLLRRRPRRLLLCAVQSDRGSELP